MDRFAVGRVRSESVRCGWAGAAGSIGLHGRLQPFVLRRFVARCRVSVTGRVLRMCGVTGCLLRMCGVTGCALRMCDVTGGLLLPVCGVTGCLLLRAAFGVTGCGLRVCGVTGCGLRVFGLTGCALRVWSVTGCLLLSVCGVTGCVLRICGAARFRQSGRSCRGRSRRPFREAVARPDPRRRLGSPALLGFAARRGPFLIGARAVACRRRLRTAGALAYAAQFFGMALL